MLFVFRTLVFADRYKEKYVCPVGSKAATAVEPSETQLAENTASVDVRASFPNW